MTRPVPRSTLPILALCAAAALAPRAAALEPPVPDLAAAAAAGPASTAAYGARCIGPANDDTAAFQAAIDTGHTVYAPAMGGHCHITHPLVMRTPGQIFGGDGRARTRIEIEPGFTGEGVFVARTGEPGPVWRDFSVSFAQPDTQTVSQLTSFPAAFEASKTPRFEIDHVGCYRATACIDMHGNSGGASIDDLQMSAFKYGIDIDGSLDTIRLTSIHWFPFALSKRQTAAFTSAPECPAAITSGRLDNLMISRSLFGGCIGIKTRQTTSGTTNGVIADSNFDTNSGISQDGGNLVVTGCHFALGTSASRAIELHHGIMNVVGAFFLVGADTTSAVIENISGVLMTLTASTIFLDRRNTTVFEQKDGVSRIVGNTFIVSGVERTKPLIVYTSRALELSSNMVITSGAPGIYLSTEHSMKGLTLHNNELNGWSIKRNSNAQ